MWIVTKMYNSTYNVFDGIGCEFYDLNQYQAKKLCKYCNDNKVYGKLPIDYKKLWKELFPKTQFPFKE